MKTIGAKITFTVTLLVVLLAGYALYANAPPQGVHQTTPPVHMGHVW